MPPHRQTFSLGQDTLEFCAKQRLYVGVRSKCPPATLPGVRPVCAIPPSACQISAHRKTRYRKAARCPKFSGHLANAAKRCRPCPAACSRDSCARSRESGNECRRFLAPGDRDTHALPVFTGAELRIATDQVRQHCQTSARPASRDWPHTAFWVHGKGAHAEVNMRGCRVAAQIHRDLSCSAARSRGKMPIALLMRRCIAETAMAFVCEASR